MILGAALLGAIIVMTGVVVFYEPVILETEDVVGVQLAILESIISIGGIVLAIIGLFGYLTIKNAAISESKAASIKAAIKAAKVYKDAEVEKLTSDLEAMKRDVESMQQSMIGVAKQTGYDIDGAGISASKEDERNGY